MSCKLFEFKHHCNTVFKKKKKFSLRKAFKLELKDKN